MLVLPHVPARHLGRLARKSHLARPLLRLAPSNFSTSILRQGHNAAEALRSPAAESPKLAASSHFRDDSTTATDSIAEAQPGPASQIYIPETTKEEAPVIVDPAADVPHGDGVTDTDVASSAADAINASAARSEALLGCVHSLHEHDCLKTEQTSTEQTSTEQPKEENYQRWVSESFPKSDYEVVTRQHTKRSSKRSRETRPVPRSTGFLDALFLAHEQHEKDSRGTRSSSDAKPSIRMPWYKRRVEGVISPEDGLVPKDATPTDEQRPIAQLSHGLTRVLFNPGVHWMKDPRSKHLNFPGWVRQVPKVDTFAFDRVTGFVTSSKDQDLRDLARKEGCSFAGSTSSLTGMLSQIYFLLSGELPVDTSVLTSAFYKEPRSFTPGQRMPVSVTIRYTAGVYTVDSEAPHLGKRETILSRLGTLLEKHLTLPLDQFKRLLHTSDNPDTSMRELKEPYRYTKLGKLMMRAQLDCHHRSLPGTGVFDIKTRAALPIRMDVDNYEDYCSYRITNLTGLEHSFEKEYYDMIRSAFLKYSFQARIGNMDGIMVAYHNTAEIFGFQYIPLEEMDTRLYGHRESGPRVFEKCAGMLEAIFTEIVTYFPEQDVHCTWETLDSGRMMHVWIEPETWAAGHVKPVVQLDIKITNFVDQLPTTGRKAVTSWEEPWSVQYSIAKSALPLDKIIAARHTAHERQWHIVKFGLNANDLLLHGDSVNPALLEKDTKKSTSSKAKKAKGSSRRKSRVAKPVRQHKDAASHRDSTQHAPGHQDPSRDRVTSVMEPRSDSPSEIAHSLPNTLDEPGRSTADDPTHADTALSEPASSREAQ